MKRRLVGVIVGLIAVAAISAAPAWAAAPDPERYSTTPTPWAWYFTASPATISSYVSANNMRLIDIEVVATSPLTFSVAMVRNTGTYSRSWYWWYNQTTTSLGTNLAGKRLLDLETYTVNGFRRYAAVAVGNTGTSFKSYRWYVNSTPAYIAGRVSAFGGRIIDIDRAGSGLYNAVLLKNTGVDARPWWYYYAVTPAQIAGFLSTNGARLVDIEPEGGGRYTVVMVRSTGAYWIWKAEATAAQVSEAQAQAGMRIYDIERYINTSGQIRYAVLLLNNVDAFTTKLRQIMWPAAKDAAFGFYLKQVDGPVVTRLQERKVFEPASMIKVLHNLTAILRMKNNGVQPTEQINWYRHPDDPSTDGDESMNGGICAYTDEGVPITTLKSTNNLSFVLSGMMMQSDNRMTDAIYNRFGRSAINATASYVGMTQTTLYHRIGCPQPASVQPFHRNELTLADDGLLFEKVARASNPILGVGVFRSRFYQYMSSGLSRFTTVVNEEASKLGKSGIAGTFINNMRGAYKPGGYLNGVDGYCNDQGCTKLLSRSTGGGWISLPFKQNGTTVRRSFVYGNFVDGIFDCGGRHTEADPKCDPLFDAVGTARDQEFKEMLRPQIKAALQTW